MKNLKPITMKKYIYILTLVLNLINFTLFAQVDCSKALQQDLIAQSIDKTSAIHYLNIIDEDLYDTAKSEGGFGLELPIEGIPFGVDADFSDFSEWRKEKFRKEEFIHNTSFSSTFLSRKVSDNGYKSFDNCMRLQSGEAGLFIKVVDSDEEVVEIEIFFKPGPGKNSPLKISNSELINGNIAGIDAGKIFDEMKEIIPFEKIRLYVTRIESQETVRGKINASGLTTSFKVNGYTAPIPPPPCKFENVKIDASSFIESTNICNNCHNYGAGIITNKNSTDQENKAVYEVNIKCSGQYEIEIYYAAAESRPLQLLVNNETINSNACNGTTGGFKSRYLKWEKQGLVTMEEGINRVELYRNSYFPHIRSIRFTPK